MDVVTELDRITFKVIGGVLDFYFFVPQDSKPNSVVQSYTTLIGKPMMPAQWMLGVHHAHDGYSNISQMRSVLDEYRNQSIPLEALWLDLDVADNNKSFTLDPDRFPLNEMALFSQQLHSSGYKLVSRVDPSIPVQKNYSAYEKGSNASVYIKNEDGSDYICETSTGEHVFIDWWNPNITEYWDQQVSTWMNLLKLDGLWSSMNEPSCLRVSKDSSLNNSTMVKNDTFSLEFDLQQMNMSQVVLKGRDLLYPGYAINNGAGNLSDNTVSMIARHYGNQSHYDIHNLYGLAESYITRNVSPIIMSFFFFGNSPFFIL
jgi:alpha-glucosidase (family GH31 glycosyl hydrolase)